MKISFSQYQTYKTCPKQYEFANVKKLGRTISAGESFGSSMHNTLAKFGKLEMGLGGRELGVGDQLRLFSESDTAAKPPTPNAQILTQLWHQSFIVQGYTSKADADAARKKGERILEYFFDWWSATSREVVAIERGFSIQLTTNNQPFDSAQDRQPTTLTGRFDRIERTTEGLHVIDYKTSKVRPQKDIDADTQLSMYALACQQMFGELPTALTLLFLREDGITQCSTVRSEDDLATLQEGIVSVSDSITAGDFAATPSEGVCSRCPFKSVCSDAVG